MTEIGTLPRPYDSEYAGALHDLDEAGYRPYTAEELAHQFVAFRPANLPLGAQHRLVEHIQRLHATLRALLAPEEPA